MIVAHVQNLDELRHLARSWRANGACLAEDPDLFFPLGNSSTAQMQAEEAKDVCRRCPVIEACAEWALDTREPHGIWGGLTEAERRSILRRQGRARTRPPSEPAQCGTPAAARRHRRRGEPVCGLCADAALQASRRREEKRQAAERAAS